MRPDLVLTQPASNVWTIGNATIAYFPVLDVETVECAIRLTLRWISLQIVMSAEDVSALRHVMNSLIGRLTPVILSVDDFVNLAVSAAAVDARIAYRKAVLEFLTNYNRRAAGVRSLQHLLIDMPDE